MPLLSTSPSDVTSCCRRATLPALAELAAPRPVLPYMTHMLCSTGGYLRGTVPVPVFPFDRELPEARPCVCSIFGSSKADNIELNTHISYYAIWYSDNGPQLKRSCA